MMQPPAVGNAVKARCIRTGAWVGGVVSSVDLFRGVVRLCAGLWDIGVVKRTVFLSDCMKESSFRFPEGYERRPDGVHVRPTYEKQMMRLWRRSSVMGLNRWNPKLNGSGRPIGPRWHVYYRKTLRNDVSTGRLTKIEGAQLLEYLDILGT